MAGVLGVAQSSRWMPSASASCGASPSTASNSIDVPARPQEVIVAPDNKVAYVSCDQSGKVAVISLSDWKVKEIIDAGAGADGLAYAAVR